MRRRSYSVHRDILDEGAVDEMAEKSDSKTSLGEKVKRSMRYGSLHFIYYAPKLISLLHI